VVEQLILHGFRDYIDPELLAYQPEQNFCSRQGVSFNHEAGPHYAENNFQLLREIYSRRVANFEQALLDPRPLLLVAHSSATMGIYPAQVEGMRRVVHHVSERRTAPTRLIVLKTHEPGARPGCGEVDDADLSVHFLPLPWKGYVWYNPQSFLSEQGFALERHMVNLLSNALDRLRVQAGLVSELSH